MDFGELARVAEREALFVFVQSSKEREPPAHLRFPRREVDRLRQRADLTRVEVSQVALLQELLSNKRLVPASVLDHVAIDLQHPQPTQQLLVERLRREPV